MKMKCNKLIPISALACLLLASCKKNDAVNSPSPVFSEDITNTVNLVDLGLDEATSAGDLDYEDNAATSSSTTSNSVVSSGKVSNSVACEIITFSDPQRKYPYTQTDDFGTGCQVTEGLVLSGKVIFQIKADWRTAPNGTLVSTKSYDNYKKNGLTVTGSQSTYIESGSGTANIMFKNVISETYRDADGNTSTFVAEMHRKIISGGETKTRSDDVYEYTGTMIGAEVHVPISLSQVSGWKATIDASTAVTRASTCAFRQTGTVKIDVIYTNATIEHQKLNYGTGECDNLGTLTVGQNEPKNVKLPLIFFNSKI